MYETSLSSVTAEVEALLAEKLSAKGLNLSQKFKSVRRKLPKSVRAHARYLVEAETRYQNPKFAHQYDPKRLLTAHKHCVSYLENIDLRRQKSFRRTAIVAGSLVNTLILIAVMVAVYFYWFSV